MQMAAADIAGQCDVPPHDLTAERAVLGAILLDNAALDRVSLEPEAFYDRRHKLVFRTMQRLAAQGTALDYVTVHAALKAESEQPLGSYLSELAEATPSAANVADHAEIVRDKAEARSLITLTMEISQRAQADEPVGPLCKRLLQRAATLTDQHQAPTDEFKSYTLAELKNRPREKVEPVVDGLLKRGGLSLFVGDAKAGKSLTCRTLTWAVATGNPWLGRETTPGGVLYLALEEDADDVEDHFWQMGLMETDSVRVAYMKPLERVIPKLKRHIERVKPILVIVDTIAHLLDFGGDANDYIKVTRTLKPLLDLARESRAHIMIVHHTRKSGGDHGADALGSTAFRGITDTTFTLKRIGEQGRSIQSMGRGRWCRHIAEPLRLVLHPETGRIEPGSMKKEFDTNTTGEEILTFLKGQAKSVTEKEMKAAVGGDTRLIQAALRALVAEGKVERTGEGKRGKPYRYTFILPPLKTENAGNEKRSNGSGAVAPEKMSHFPISPIEGTETNEIPQTIADHVVGLTDAARDEAINQLVSGLLH